TDAVEHRVHFLQGTFCDLHDTHTVLGVAGRLAQTGHLSTEALADDETGRVVGSTVDPETRRQLLEALAEGVARLVDVPVGVERHDVLVDTHCESSMIHEFSGHHPWRTRIPGDGD